MSEAAVLEEQILAALDDGLHSPVGTAGYDLMAEHFPKAVIAAVGDQLDQPVTFASLCMARARYHAVILDNRIVMDSFPPNVAEILAIEYGEKIVAFDTLSNSAHILHASGMTDHDLMHRLGVNSDMLQAYDAGTLTFRVLVTKQPSLFMLL